MGKRIAIKGQKTKGLQSPVSPSSLVFVSNGHSSFWEASGIGIRSLVLEGDRKSQARV